MHDTGNKSDYTVIDVPSTWIIWSRRSIPPGIVPDSNVLLDRSSHCKLLKFPHASGIVPAKLLLDNMRYSRSVIFDTCVGRRPVNKLLPASNATRLGMGNVCKANRPDSWFRPMYKNFNDNGKRGSTPVKALLDTSRNVKDVRWEKLSLIHI